MIRCYYGNINFIRVLLELNKVDINYRDKRVLNATPIMAACNQGHTEIIRLLIKEGANIEDVDDRGRTPLIIAAMASKHDVIRVLLDNGSNPHRRDNNYNTFLYYLIDEKFIREFKNYVL